MMQRLFFLVLFNLCMAAQLSAQCQYVAYYLNTTGFVCGDGLGTICVETNGDLAGPPGECYDYVVEISFPTGSFIYTDLGSFVEHEVTMSTTKLWHQPAYIAGIWTTGCLEGVIQVPNTVFTITIVNSLDETDIVSTETFLLDDFEEVGTAGTTTLLSDAIAAMDLLDAPTAVSTAQTVLINGTLVIDQDYTFGVTFPGPRNDLNMAPGSRIEVQDGNQLVVTRGDIHGCDDQWDRINVQSNATFVPDRTRISDAVVGTELQDQSTLILPQTHYRDNGIGIGSFGANQKDITLSLFSGFASSPGVTDGDIGCHFQNVNFVDLQGYFFLQRLQDGIILENTSLMGDRLIIRDCTNGVSVLEASNFLGITESEIRDGAFGIATVGNVEMQVATSTFDELAFGIIRGSGGVNEHSLIESNIMTNCGTNIFGFVQPSSAEVQFNELTADQSNVVLFGMGAGQHHWAIQHNEHLFSGFGTQGANAFFFGMNDARIFRNKLAFAIGNNNFTIFGGQNCKIGYNQQCFADRRNLQVFGSPTSLIYCNDFADGQNGINIMNTCSGSTIRGNDMSSSSFNLVYGSSGNTFAVTGAQNFQGNRFDASSEGAHKALHFGSSTVAQESQYKVGWLAGSQGTTLFPFFTSSFNEWFKKDHNGFDYSCPVVMTPNEGPQLDALAEAVKTNINLLQGGIKDAYGPEVEFDIQLKMFRDLEVLSQNRGLDQTEQYWYNLLDVTEIGEFIAFEEVYKNATAYSDSDATLAQDMSADIKTLSAEIKSIVWYTEDRTNDEFIVDENQKTARDAKLAELETLIADLTALNQTKTDALATTLPQLDALNSGINASRTASGLNLKTVNDLLLTRFNPGFTEFTPVELQTLRGIADQCVGVAGEAVYTARGLVAEATKSYQEYNDECLQEIAPGRSNGQRPKLLDAELSVSPNPANEELVISLSEDHQRNTLYLRDVMGKTIREIAVAKGQQSIILNVADLADGIYFLQSDDVRYEALKVVIGH